MSNLVSLYIYRFSEEKALDPKAILDAGELEAFLKMTSDKRRSEYLHGRLLIKTVMHNLHSVKNPKIQRNRHGKPSIRGYKINLSHSKDFLVLAVSKSRELGVDIERSGDKKYFKQIVEQYFSSQENKYIFSTSLPEVQQTRFKNLWCLKEAYVKAFNGIITKKSLQIYFDLGKKRIEKSPTRKEIHFHLNSKLNLAVCAVGKAQLKAYDLKFTKGQKPQLKESKLKFIPIS